MCMGNSVVNKYIFNSFALYFLHFQVSTSHLNCLNVLAFFIMLSVVGTCSIAISFVNFSNHHTLLDIIQSIFDLTYFDTNLFVV